MKRVALFFPGQGAQYPGMLSSFFDDKKPCYQKVYEAITPLKKLGLDLQELGIRANKEELALTYNTQPLTVAHSLFHYQELENFLVHENIDHEVELVMGHSVGEFSAMAVSGVISYQDVLATVYHRGKFMQEATKGSPSTMAAVLGVDVATLDQICKKVQRDDHWVEIANFNSPNQLVIAGHTKACEEVTATLAQVVTTRHKVIFLNVSAAFHTKIMDKAAHDLKALLDKIPLQDATTPMFAGCNASYYQFPNAKTVKLNWVNGLKSPVKWLAAMSKAHELLEEDVIAIELGPGQVLKGLAKKIAPEREFYSWDKEKDKILEILQKD